MAGNKRKSVSMMTVLAAACGSANKRRARSRIRMLQPPKSVRPIGYYDALLVCVYICSTIA